MRRFLATLALLALVAPSAWAQDSLDVTFRFLPDLTASVIDPVVRAFAPGTMPNGTVNDWGPNSSGTIRPGAASEMTFDASRNEYRYTQRLKIGDTHQYKIHYHTNAVAAGSPGYGGIWIADPLNLVVVGNDGNSQMVVADPMVFQLAREQDGGDAIGRVSAGVFATGALTALTFEINGVVRDGLGFYDAATGRFSYDLPSSVAPGSQFRITATTARGTATSEIGLKPPTVTDQARPAGLRDGMTVNADGSVTLSLFAPYKTYVYAIGDFSDWKADNAYLLKRDAIDADNVYFWGTIPAADVPANTRFQYFVDGLIRVADPYSEVVLSPFNDRFIDESVFPNMPAYPEGKTSELVGLLKPTFADTTPRSCDVSTYERPKQEELVIYELLIRDFLGEHSFDALTDTLDYLSDLGVTAIELMPVSEFDGNESWGYNPSFHLALDKYYGSPASFQRMVDEAHCRGMAVILDVVYNHATGQSPLIRLYNQSATGSPSAEPAANNPYANQRARHPFNVFNDLNHDSQATRNWLDRANAFWIERYNVDGYRFDLSKGFTQRQSGDVGAWNRYDQSRVNNLTRMADKIWEVDAEAHIILEHIGGQDEETVLVNHGRDQGKPGMMVWSKSICSYNQATMGYANGPQCGWDLSGAYFGQGGRGFANTGPVAILEDHDEQRLMRKNSEYGNVGPNGYSVKDYATATQRMGAAGAFFFALPGPKMIWQWGELGYGAETDECLPEEDECPGGRTDNRGEGWDYLETQAGRDLYNTWSNLMQLRKAQSIFTDPNTSVRFNLNRADGGKWLHLVEPVADGEDPLEAWVIGNFDTSEKVVSTNFACTLEDGCTNLLYDYFSGETITYDQFFAGISLAPGTFRVYTDAFVGTATATSNETTLASATLTLGAPAPHPVRGMSRLTFSLDRAGSARLDVFDTLGRLVATVVDADLSAGPHEATLNASDLASGLYILRLTTDDATLTGTFVRAGR